jgi:hypothetical protein
MAWIRPLGVGSDLSPIRRVPAKRKLQAFISRRCLDEIDER